MQAIKKVISTIRALLSSSPDDQDAQLLEQLSGSDELELELAYAVMLMDLALIDQNFHQREYEYLVGCLKSEFDLTTDQIRDLIGQAGTLLGYCIGTHSLALQLASRLTHEQRVRLMNMMAEMIRADGVEDGFELYLKKKFCDILEVSWN